MASNADVRSLEQLESFYEQMRHFRTQLLREVENVGTELRRLTQWLEIEAVNYWKDELKAAQRKFVDAQDNLSRCMSYVRSDERRPCTEEKKRVAKTKQRRDLCEMKLKTVNAAATHWERERTKNQAHLERCRDMADSDLLVALNHLQGQLQRLGDYANLRSAALAVPEAAEVEEADSSSPVETDLSKPMADQGSAGEQN
ncbi:MAG: hypothetical protein R3C53_15835 [Pirellulaceae bacterium]